MGLDICVIKLGKRLCDKPTDEMIEKYSGDEAVYISSENYEPFKHLSKVTPGYYLVDSFGDSRFSTGYGGFMRFRQDISRLFLRMDYMDFIAKMEKCPESLQNKPFLEMLWFSDCDGSFDSVIARKLFEDFIWYKKAAEWNFDSRVFDMYNQYQNVLREAIEIDGVVFYH